MHLLLYCSYGVSPLNLFYGENKLAINNHTEPWELQPTICFSEDHAYVGAQIHTPTRNGNFIIRDDGLMRSPPELLHEGITIQPERCTNYPKWSQESINAFRQGNYPITESNELLQQITNTIRTYVDFEDERFYAYLALWYIGTYYHQLFNSYPYIFLNGPAQSGKTKLLTLSSCIAFNAQLSLHMNFAGIFRMVESTRCTLLLDEVEHLGGRMRNPEFRTMLLGGYIKGGNVQRMVRYDRAEDFQPRNYATYSPKMFANIAGIDEVLETRCVVIHTQRSRNNALTRTEVQIDNPEFQQIRDVLFVFMMRNWREIKAEYDGTLEAEGIASRDWQLWRPILSLARYFGGQDLFTTMAAFALEGIADRRLDNADSNENLLIEALIPLVTADGFYRLSEIRTAFVGHLEDGNWVKERYVARLLRSVGFSTRRRRNYGFEYLIEATRVRNLAQAYGIAIGEEGVAGEANEPNANQSEGVVQ
jgi:hypothetical protein